MRLLELQPTRIPRRRNYTEIRLAQIIRLLRSPGPWTDQETTYIRLLQSCATLKALAEGKQVHSHMVKHGLKPNNRIWSLLISVYSNCGCFSEAHHALKSMPNRTTDAWTALIAAYAYQGCHDPALDSFYNMVQEGISANETTIVFVLNACAGLVALKDGLRIHDYIITNGHETGLTVQNSVLKMYCKCCGMYLAEKVFASMDQRNEESWTALIGGYVDHGLNDQAVVSFRQMLDARIRPSKNAFGNVLKACADLGTLVRGRDIHEQIKSVGLGSDTLLNSMLITMYSRCGSIQEARKAFDQMPRKDITSWNAMLGAYKHHAFNKEALKIFDRLKREPIEPDIVTASILVNVCTDLRDLVRSREVYLYIKDNRFKGKIIVLNNVLEMYIKCEAIEEAHQIFHNLRKRDIGMFDTLITGYVQLERAKDALELFRLMREEGLRPNESIINVLCDGIALEQGDQRTCHVG